MRKIIEVDSRNRVSLGALGTAKFYIASVADDGTILLQPAVIMPLTIHNDIEDFFANPESGVTVERPAKKADTTADCAA